ADATVAQIAAFEADHGLDKPIILQYVGWLAELPVKGFATSYMTGQSVNQRLAETVGLSVELVCLTFVLSVLGSILMGSVSAFWENRWPDHLVRFFAMLSLSVPGFWLGLL